MPNNTQPESAFIQDPELYKKKVQSVPAPDRKRDVDLDNTLYDNIVGAGMSSVLDIAALDSMSHRAQDRNQMYNVLDVMCEDGTISAVVDTYAEDATERNDKGNIVWVESSNPEVSECVEYLLDSLNINKNIYRWCHSLCKYGDVYLRLYRQSEYSDELISTPSDKNKSLNEDIKIKAYKRSDKYAHYMEMVSNPATMFELTKFGKTVGYVQAPVTSTLRKNENTTFTTFNYAYKFKKDDITIYPATEFVHACLEDNSTRDDELVEIFMTQDAYDNDSTNYAYKVKRGQSLLSSIYKDWRQLQLLENSVLLNRLTKSSIVRLINVEVGDMPKEAIQKTLLGVKQMVEQKAALNNNNSMSEYTNPGPIENNVYVPTHEGVGNITTTQIGGDVDIKSLADLDYYMNKMFGALRVPKQYFGQTDDSAGFSGGQSLAIISSRYAKMVKRIQTCLIQAITDAINLMLIDMELDRYVNEFKIHMLTPTTQEEVDRRDNLSGKIQIVTDVMSMLSDIEDPTIRLKALKSLLANALDNTDIVELIQHTIEEMESEADAADIEETDIEDTIEGESSDMMGSDSMSGDGVSDIGAPDLSDTDPSQAESEILPTPDELGIDMSDTEEEE